MTGRRHPVLAALALVGALTGGGLLLALGPLDPDPPAPATGTGAAAGAGGTATPGAGRSTDRLAAALDLLADDPADPAAATAPLPTPPTPPPTTAPAGPPTHAQLAAGAGVEAVVGTAVAAEGSVEAWAERPADGARPGPATWAVPVVNEFGGPLHVAVEEQVGGWLRVQLPVRPNGTQGWIRADAVTLAPVRTRVEIDLSDRVLRAFLDGELVVEATSTVGRPTAPTPLGRSYLRDSFAWDPASVYGAYVLPLSVFSETIEVINGGEAVVAIHGTNRPEVLGRAGSLGCIRVDNETITQLAHLVAPGTPVDIRA